MAKKIVRFQPLSWADNVQALKMTGSDIRTAFIVKDLYAGFTATDRKVLANILDEHGMTALTSADGIAYLDAGKDMEAWLMPWIDEDRAIVAESVYAVMRIMAAGLCQQPGRHLAFSSGETVTVNWLPKLSPCNVSIDLYRDIAMRCKALPRLKTLIAGGVIDDI